MPDGETAEFKINDRDIKIEVMKGSGAGGQSGLLFLSRFLRRLFLVRFFSFCTCAALSFRRCAVHYVARVTQTLVHGLWQ